MNVTYDPHTNKLLTSDEVALMERRWEPSRLAAASDFRRWPYVERYNLAVQEGFVKFFDQVCSALGVPLKASSELAEWGGE